MNFAQQRRAALKEAGVKFPIKRNTPPEQIETIRREMIKLNWIGCDWWAAILKINKQKAQQIKYKGGIFFNIVE